MPKVKIFATTTCPYCRMEKEYLTAKEIPFENVFIDEKSAEAVYILEKSGQRGVPVTEIRFEDGRVEYVLGYDRARLNVLLGIEEAD